MYILQYNNIIYVLNLCITIIYSSMKRVDFWTFGCKVLEDLYIIYKRIALKLAKYPIFQENLKNETFIYFCKHIVLRWTVGSLLLRTQ